MPWLIRYDGKATVLAKRGTKSSFHSIEDVDFKQIIGE